MRLYGYAVMRLCGYAVMRLYGFKVMRNDMCFKTYNRITV